ncbi:MAG TPA: DUF4926 domain-containing protein [Polyangiaceae bacterium]|nr:DUF4926 domain-containing protein [Polyangiaceae bacterium]
MISSQADCVTFTNLRVDLFPGVELPISVGPRRNGLDGFKRQGFLPFRDCLRWVNMFNPLDTVVLDRDLPEHGLRRGNLGAVVDLHAPDGPDVEFVMASGKTQALVSLGSADIRAVGDADLIAVHDLKRTA